MGRCTMSRIVMHGLFVTVASLAALTLQSCSSDDSKSLRQPGVETSANTSTLPISENTSTSDTSTNVTSTNDTSTQVREICCSRCKNLDPAANLTDVDAVCADALVWAKTQGIYR